MTKRKPRLIGKLSKGGKPERDWWDELSPRQKFELIKGVRETYDESKLIPHEEVMKMFEKYRLPAQSS